jgi:hypothetical protein
VREQVHLVTIVTSIGPSRVESQQEAVASWLQLGFSVQSLNIAGEVDSLCDLFPGVTFTAVDRHPDGKTGSRIYLAEILAQIGGMPGSVFGLVNSDIFFRADRTFPSFIDRSVSGGMVFGSRIDVAGDGVSVVNGNPPGFDFFFFHRSILPLYPVTSFCLGMPVWDYWFPLLPLLTGYSVKRLVSPVAYHRHHPASWGEGENGHYLEELRRSLLLDPIRQKLAASGHNISASPLDFARLQQLLRYHAGVLFLDDDQQLPPGGGSVSREDYAAMNRDLLALARANTTLADEKAALLASRSWLMTSPLRSISAWCRRAMFPRMK